MRALLVLGVGLLALAACGGGGGELTGAPSAARPASWATPAEVAWLSRVAAWNDRFAAAGRSVGAFEAGPRFDAAARGEHGAVRAYGLVLRPVGRCAGGFATAVGPAPTGRLRRSEHGFRRACGHYRRGVSLLLRALARRDAGLAERARAAIEQAGREASVAAGTLPPGEKQALPVSRRDGTSRVEPVFSAAASAVAGKEVEARCWSARDWERLMVEERAYTRGKVNDAVLGFASAGGERLNLAPAVCRELARVADQERAPVRRYAVAAAVATLAHEAAHASGVADEAAAECQAIQWLARVAEELGAARIAAAALREAYWERYDGLPSVYRSPECRDGGELDLERGSGGFP